MDRELLAAIGDLLDNKLDEKLDEKLEPIRQDIAGLDQKVTGLDQKVTGLQQDVAGLKQDVAGLQQDMTGVKQDVTGLQQDVAGLDQKVTGLDQKVTGLQKQNDTIARAVFDLQEDHKIINEIRGTLFNIESEFKVFHKGQERIETRLDHLETMFEVNYRDHETRIQALESKTPA